ncbi:MAG: hypothetical protein ABIS50_00260 [Luteolibacter sp.]|uniref:hypothetical protein n=1 Tax=Luteolibacter sp. TaxID=1962973 RepID=UPI003262DAB1
MIRIKTLSLPLISALVAGSALPANAQLSFSLSSKITYRQNKKGIFFQGGTFNSQLLDGSATYISGCEWYQYYGPGFYNNICSPGTTALISAGTIDGINPAYPYFLVSSIYPAFIVAPRKAEKIFLNAAPASTLPRPSGGFTDNSYSLFYNLTVPSTISEYVITNYYKRTGYTSKQRDKFQSDIVPGVYYYSFPRLGNPDIPAPIAAVIYPMLEGKQEINNTVSGFEFTKVNGNKWNKDGFIEMSYLRPNSINWTGMSPTTVFASADSLYFSIKAIANDKDPTSDTVTTYAGKPFSIFPPYQNGGEPRVLLPTPYATSFTTPPIFNANTTGVVQLDLRRNLQTGGVTYDFSTRTFQIPVVVVDRYTEYVDIDFPTSSKGTGILEDPDKDGYNNLNEWILDSNASNSASIPIAPVTELVQPVDPFFGLPTGFSYFGFDVKKKLGTIPGVIYTLQRSKDQGKTWSKFKTDTDWTVQTVRTAAIANLPASATIQVRSLVYDTTTGTPIQPPGTDNDIYRVKITLKK